MKTNALYYGDDFDILRRYVPDESVDLIYVDPPFVAAAQVPRCAFPSGFSRP